MTWSRPLAEKVIQNVLNEVNSDIDKLTVWLKNSSTLHL